MDLKFLGEFSEFPMGHVCMIVLFNIEQHFKERNLSVMVNSVGSQYDSHVISLLFKIEQRFKRTEKLFLCEFS